MTTKLSKWINKQSIDDTTIYGEIANYNENDPNIIDSTTFVIVAYDKEIKSAIYIEFTKELIDEHDILNLAKTIELSKN